MLRRLRAEAANGRYGIRAALWLALSPFVCAACRYGFGLAHPGAGGAELLVWVLDDPNYVLMIFTFLLLAFTAAKDGGDGRYPVLLRQKSRGGALAVRLGAMMTAGSLGLLVQAGSLLVWGQGLPARERLYPLAGSIGRVVCCQLLNISSYMMAILLLREIFHRLFRGAGVEFLCTMLLPLATRAAVLNYNTRLVLLSPWGSIAYTLAYNLPGKQTVNGLGVLAEVERADYRFFWQYWLAVLAVLFGVALWLERNRDYVFEQHRRAG